MENETPAASQESTPSTTKKPEPATELESSPTLPTPPRLQNVKPRKPPTITPRSFTRFFTPKASTERGGKIGASRRALKDITTSGTNRGRSRRVLQDCDNDLADDVSTRKHRSKRHKTWQPPSPDITPQNSSPLRRIQDRLPREISESDNGKNCSLTDDEDNTSTGDSEISAPFDKLERIRRSKTHSHLGQVLRRETGAGPSRMTAVTSSYSPSYQWQYETSKFFTKPEGFYRSTDVERGRERTFPFCTAACQTNSLVAIGDENGGIRLLETAKDSAPGFEKPWVSFRPHSNAVLDLAFSPDDLLLATASGDQTSRVVDMHSQRAIHTMTGHYSSVKQIRFQPESSHVLASSSRDGSVQIWDLRCKGMDGPTRDIKVPLDPAPASGTQTSRKMTWARAVNAIYRAHSNQQTNPIIPYSRGGGSGPKPTPTSDPPSKSEIPGRSGDVSVTALAFLRSSHAPLILTASEANASVKLWDLRTTYNHLRSNRSPTPLSSTTPPEGHSTHRDYGVTSMSISGDGARLYTLCRDSTVYAYSTSHLVLGHSSHGSGADVNRTRRGVPQAMGRDGLGPIYGFRHPKFHATTFYVKSALRPARDDNSEMLAVGSSDGCVVLFPTDERYLSRQKTKREMNDVSSFISLRGRPGLSRTSSGLTAKMGDTIPIYDFGSALVNGHSKEVTGMTWTDRGELVTIGDDYIARCWREDDATAKDLRIGGESQGRRWRCGWAEVQEGWDDDEY